MDLGATEATLADVDVVGLLIEDVVDSVDQQIERKSHPEEQPDCIPAPEFSGEPDGHHRGSYGVDP